MNNFSKRYPRKHLVREACQKFIDYPSLDNWLAIKDIGVDVPCVAGDHHCNFDGSITLCGDCPLGNFVERLDKRDALGFGNIVICPMAGLRTSLRDLPCRVYEAFPGELVIAMVQFVEGWRDDDE